ncbi:MAG TPA: Spy/CpxP family protein refolding chaperone [Rhizomicrobium sp.]|nr:Spy/CpxP family protein refolding chaperone [Rhizomicrobium sp.]
MTTARFLGVSALSVFLFAAGAQAQMPPQMPPPNPQLQQLHDALHLRADQDAAWGDYVRSTSVDPQEMAQRRDAAQRMSGLSAPARVDLSVQMMKLDLASLQRRGAALKTFYAGLTPEQQATFDRETMRPPQGM